MSKPVVAIVGRPNVGKSTLFNRIVGKRVAIVEDTPGITRDRIYAEADWLNRRFVLVDTGGLVLDKKDALTTQVSAQVQIATSEADVILLLVDITEGLLPADLEVARLLRRTQKPVFLVVNKVENEKQEREAAEFFALGLGQIYPISAIHGRGIAELLDKILDKIIEILPENVSEEVYLEEAIRVAIVGRPNVGKSSLLNAILQEERSIVSDIPGTTRDAIDTYFKYDSKTMVLIDTAGIRRAGKIQQSVEYYSVLRAIRAIERSDVVLLLMDASEGMTDGDKRVGGYAHEAGKGAVIVINKWDLVVPRGANFQEFSAGIRRGAPFLSYAPIVAVSALKNWGISEVLDCAIQVAESHAHRLPTGEVNRLIHDAVDERPLVRKGKTFKVYYATMPAVKPPTIVLFVNEPDLFHFSYRRYLENRIRRVYPFEGTPLRIFARKAENTERR